MPSLYTTYETETRKIPSYANLTKDLLRTPNFVEMIELVKTQCTVYFFSTSISTINQLSHVRRVVLTCGNFVTNTGQVEFPMFEKFTKNNQF